MRVEFIKEDQPVAIFKEVDGEFIIEGARRSEIEAIIDRGYVTDGPLIVTRSVGVGMLVLHFAESAVYSQQWFDSYAHDAGDVQLWDVEEDGPILI